MDAVHIKGIYCRAHHGVFKSERQLGQTFIVDLSLYLNLKPAADDDDLNKTVDYSQVIDFVNQQMQSKPRKLIETAAEDIVHGLFAQFKPVVEIKVMIHKPAAPVNSVVQDIAVEITRARKHRQN